MLPGRASRVLLGLPMAHERRLAATARSGPPWPEEERDHRGIALAVRSGDAAASPPSAGPRGNEARGPGSWCARPSRARSCCRAARRYVAVAEQQRTARETFSTAPARAGFAHATSASMKTKQPPGIVRILLWRGRPCRSLRIRFASKIKALRHTAAAEQSSILPPSAKELSARRPCRGARQARERPAGCSGYGRPPFIPPAAPPATG